MPLLVAALSPANAVVYTVSAASLLFPAVLGALGAKAGGAAVPRATARVAFRGVAAMAVTAGIGHLVGKAV
jgi:VIT1/CCC1 family predicted Fe2+/Mn2+ transporter